jgi:solute:Na+ symporter, SSS family
MTVKSKRELNRAVLVGGIFILVMTGVAFTVGSLSNAVFVKEGALFKGRVVSDINAEKGQHALQLMKKDELTGQWSDIVDAKTGKGKVLPVVLDSENPKLGEQAVIGEKTHGVVQGRSISIVYAKGNSAKIIPLFVKSAMPPWFSLLFLLTLLAAAMSTLSSQFHAVGTSIGRDVYEQITKKKGGAGGNRSIVVVRVGIIIGILIAVVISHIAREDAYIIPRATAIFFGLCGSAFLPAFVGGLFFKRMTRPAAISSMLVGFGVTAFWLLLVKSKEASSLGLVGWLTDGKTSILAGHPNWDVVDPIVIALPLSILTAIVVSMLTQPPSKEHLDKCFAAK